MHLTKTTLEIESKKFANPLRRWSAHNHKQNRSGFPLFCRKCWFVHVDKLNNNRYSEYGWKIFLHSRIIHIIFEDYQRSSEKYWR